MSHPVKRPKLGSPDIDHDISQSPNVNGAEKSGDVRTMSIMTERIPFDAFLLMACKMLVNP